MFFPRDSLPAVVQTLAMLLPLSHGIDLVRAITLDRPVEYPLLHAGVLLAWGLAGVGLSIRIAGRRLAG